MAWEPGMLRLTIQSAFCKFVSMSDYAAAAQVADVCPDAFISPGLRGWRAAVRGSLNPEQAVEIAEHAAEGWLHAQRRYRERTFRIMHLNIMVDWILRNGLMSALREALNESEIPIID
jgi:hypothetical protein